MLPNLLSFSWSLRAEGVEVRYRLWKAAEVGGLLGAEGELLHREEGAALLSLAEVGEVMMTSLVIVVHSQDFRLS